eukprot:5694558-Amphidinium_carterae.1
MQSHRSLGAWTTYAHRNKETQESCQQECHNDPDCIASFKGDEGCYFAHTNHRLQERECMNDGEHTLADHAGRGPKDGSFHVKLSGLQCSEHKSEECGKAVQVVKNAADFSVVQPDWQGAFKAMLVISLLNSAMPEASVPVDAQSISIKRGAPRVMEVLAHVEAYIRDNTTKVVPTKVTLADDGISLTISRYAIADVTEMHLYLVVILPDPAFDVTWPEAAFEELQLSVSKLPAFEQCRRSRLLQQRYAACNQGGTWHTQPLHLVLPRWLMVRSGRTSFIVSPSTANRPTWGSLVDSKHKIELRFDGVDAPVAWAAQDLGCSVLDPSPDYLWTGVHDSEVHNAASYFADMFCELSPRGCFNNIMHRDYLVTFVQTPPGRADNAAHWPKFLACVPNVSESRSAHWNIANGAVRP